MVSATVLIVILILGPYQTVIDELNVCTIILENPPTYDDYRQSVECKHFNHKHLFDQPILSD